MFTRPSKSRCFLLCDDLKKSYLHETAEELRNSDHIILDGQTKQKRKNMQFWFWGDLVVSFCPSSSTCPFKEYDHAHRHSQTELFQGTLTFLVYSCLLGRCLY